jgi:hypothetical protein
LFGALSKMAFSWQRIRRRNNAVRRAGGTPLRAVLGPFNRLVAFRRRLGIESVDVHRAHRGWQ